MSRKKSRLDGVTDEDWTIPNPTRALLLVGKVSSTFIPACGNEGVAFTRVVLLPQQTTAPVMNRLLTGQALWCNGKHRKSCHVFQSSSKSLLRRDAGYLLEPRRCTHHNPIKPRFTLVLVEPGRHPCRAHSTLMLGMESSRQDTEQSLEMLANNPVTANCLCDQLVEDGLANLGTPLSAKSPNSRLNL